MNGPDKAGEPSMEEILASIRQIIADDPPTEIAAMIEPNPLVPNSALQERAREMTRSQEARTPLVDRLSDVLKSGPLPPTSPLGSKRPLSFDQDLADMFEEVADDAATPPVPKPDLRVPLEISSSVKAGAAESKAEIKEDLAPSVTASLPSMPSFGAPSMPFQPAPAAPSEPPMPFGSASAPAPEPVAAPSPPKTFGFPPLRKSSFYPPQPKVSAQAPSVGKDPVSSEAKPVAVAPAGGNNGHFETAVGRLAGLGAAAADPVAHNGSSLNGSSLNGSSLNGSSAPAAFGSTAARSDSPAPAGKLPDLSTLLPDVVLPELQPEPAAPGAPSAPLGPFAAETSVVAAQALDALAQGLAASAAASASASSASVPPAIALTPVLEPIVEAARASLAQSQSLAAPAAPTRTLEDAVADMLRPMLQQWVADNMPRIIEKALRVEVARTTKPGSGS